MEIPWGASIFHENGITGDGVGIAFIGPSLHTNHFEYVDNLKMYYSYIKPENDIPFETISAGAKLSNLAGKSVSYAPGVSIYYLGNSGYNDELQRDYPYSPKIFVLFSNSTVL